MSTAVFLEISLNFSEKFFFLSKHLPQFIFSCYWNVKYTKNEDFLKDFPMNLFHVKFPENSSLLIFSWCIERNQLHETG